MPGRTFLVFIFTYQSEKSCVFDPPPTPQTRTVTDRHVLSNMKAFTTCYWGHNIVRAACLPYKEQQRHIFRHAWYYLRSRRPQVARWQFKHIDDYSDNQKKLRKQKKTKKTLTHLYSTCIWSKSLFFDDDNICFKGATLYTTGKLLRWNCMEIWLTVAKQHKRKLTTDAEWDIVLHTKIEISHYPQYLISHSTSQKPVFLLCSITRGNKEIFTETKKNNNLGRLQWNSIPPCLNTTWLFFILLTLVYTNHLFPDISHVPSFAFLLPIVEGCFMNKPPVRTCQESLKGCG